MYKLMILFTAFATFTSAQAVNFTDTLGTPVIAQPKPKKDKKRAFFFAAFRPNAIARDRQELSSPYTIRPDIDTATYYQYQSLLNYKYHFEGTKGISFGVTKEKKLLKKVNLKFGYGLSIFGISSSRRQDTLSTTVLKKYKLISPGTPSTLEEKVINKEAGTEVLQYYTIPTSHVVVSFLLPFGLEYKVSSKINIGFDYNISIPISAKASGYTLYTLAKKSFYSDDLESTYIARLLVGLGLHFKYDISYPFFIEANGTIGNLFNQQLVSKSNQFYGLNRAGLYSYGLKFGYYY
jgi:hypothetical protein